MTTYYKTYFNYNDYSKLSHSEKLNSYLSLTKEELQKIPTSFTNDPIINLQDFSHKFIFDDQIPNYLLRKTYAEKLAKVDSHLLTNHNYRLKIYETYRPLSLQRAYFTEIKEQLLQENPSLPEDEFYAKLTGFIADPDVSPPHSTGGAVDLLIIDQNGIPLDFGTEINSIDDNSNLFSPNISKTAIQNRKLLMDSMLQQQIAPLATEWWHYNYGEAEWAAFFNTPILFNSVDL